MGEEKIQRRIVLVQRYAGQPPQRKKREGREPGKALLGKI